MCLQPGARGSGTQGSSHQSGGGGLFHFSEGKETAGAVLTSELLPFSLKVAGRASEGRRWWWGVGCPTVVPGNDELRARRPREWRTHGEGGKVLGEQTEGPCQLGNRESTECGEARRKPSGRTLLRRNPAAPRPGIGPQDLQAGPCTDPRPPVFAAAFTARAVRQKPPRAHGEMHGHTRCSQHTRQSMTQL